MTKRILILMTDAGLGHISAAEALEQALQRKYGDECDPHIVNAMTDERVPSLLRNWELSYDSFVTELPDVYKLGYKFSDTAVPNSVMESAITVMLFSVMRDLVRAEDPDVIVLVHPIYHAPLAAVYAVDDLDVPLITIVTDFVTVHRQWFHPIVDLCIVSTEAAREQALAGGLSPDQTEIVGIPVDPDIAAETRDVATLRSDLGWDPDLTTVLAVGGERVDNLREVLHVINHAGFPLQLVLVAGGDDDLFTHFQETTWHVPVQRYNFVENLTTMMLAADMMVCKAGGLTVTEGLAAGLPLMLIDVLPGQEEGNADYVSDGQAGVVVDSPVAALETLSHWLADDGAELRAHAAHARDLGSPRAAHTIAERIWTQHRRDVDDRRARLLLPRADVLDLLKRHDVET